MHTVCQFWDLLSVVQVKRTSGEKRSQTLQTEHNMNTQHSHTVNWKVSICRPHSEKSVRQRASARLWACPVQTNAQLRTFRCSSAALRPQPALPAAAPRTQRHSRPAALRTDAAASESGTRPADLVPPAAGPTPGAEDPASAQLQQHQGQRPLAAHSGEGRWRGGRLVFLLSATLAAGGGARAEEVVPQSADWVVSVVFTLALAALALVTLGVRSPLVLGAKLRCGSVLLLLTLEGPNLCQQWADRVTHAVSCCASTACQGR